jgi:hypothetical protein
MKMKSKAPSFLYSQTPLRWATACCILLDRITEPLRTICLVCGVLAAAAQIDSFADYVFALGLLFHLTLWFEEWWRAGRAP